MKCQYCRKRVATKEYTLFDDAIMTYNVCMRCFNMLRKKDREDIATQEKGADIIDADAWADELANDDLSQEEREE